MSRPQPIDIVPGSTLGLSYNGGHDSSVSIVRPDGRVTFACALERMTRYKQDGRFPRPLLELVDFDRIATCALPSYAASAIPTGPAGDRFHTLRHSVSEYPLHRFPEGCDALLAEVPVEKVFIGHELSHAASAYYLSGFDEAAVLSYDGGMYNEPWFGGVFAGDGASLDPLEYFPAQTNAKIASLYAVVTGLLGYKPLRHEGKLTGLAAYGEPNAHCVDVLTELLTTRYNDLESIALWVNPFDTEQPPQFVVDTQVSNRIRARFGGASPETIAASLQYVTETHVVEIVSRIRALGLSRRLCVAGGLFANVKLNQRIHQAWGGEVFVAPAMADDGAGLGAALQHVFSQGEARFPIAQPTMYLGFRYSDQEIQAVVDSSHVAYETPAAPARSVAELLAQGKTVAVFMDEMEFGPRALGHRSILADATDRGINDALNRQLRRTEFMPFAPITRREDAERVYRDLAGAERAAEYMTITLDAAAELEETCPALVHVDGTARPQLVDAAVNPFLHAVLTEYERLTGRGSVINTSFNIHEEPIICSPEEALLGFAEAGLDALFLQGHLIEFQQNRAPLSDLLRKRTDDTRGSLRGQNVLEDFLWRQVHDLQKASDDRLALVESLHRDCELYRQQLAELQNRVEQLSTAQKDVVPSQSLAAQALSESIVEVQVTEDLPQDGKTPVIDLVPPASDPGTDQQLVLSALARLEARLEQAVSRSGAGERPETLEIERLAGLEQARLVAEATAEARLRVIEEQQRAIEHYRRWRFRERLNRLIEPRIGVLYQYPSRVMEIPPHYAKVPTPQQAPAISLVTPSYNQGQFIERTMRSVLDQGYPELQYIVQDGGSSDATVAVAARFGDRLAEFESAPDSGMADALNKGFAKASGDILAYLNSDDLLLPGALNYVARVFAEHPEVDVVYGHRVVIDEYDGEIGRWVLPPHDNEVLSWADYVPQETLFWRRSLWEKVGAHIDESFRFAVDWELLLRFRDANAKMVRVPRFVGAFRVHPHQKTSAQMADVGIQEMNRLRERVHGRVVTHSEIQKALTPYLRKHVAYHKLYRAGLLRF